ncbi:uncharacterized protein LOC114357751 isoform X1 [Ostrinia furnacalis]|uniref:uncharacterized protein LOC114357751 isoform X1 n=1 Tax=Ostrinia furnacalis TaxID=93504 RepID=UPI001038A679|nr:uncharacterized protein LOC114357751 isoform X1 [Ostrinia furnacalis]XP_028167322.1 uncharacterized protein LOC114357751 isoform X1 [Ostrinia furnacalis]XP_028167323.1 uncharacterized protein LOC114357751 isoform X1 [Ostrinia furnacalis]
MLEYVAVLLIGFWLGVAIFLYASCYWLEEIFDLPPPRDAPSSASHAAPSSGASGAHYQLKRLVARVVEEAAALPALARYASEPANPPSLESSTYEDLLATAILNKVIERYQTESGSGGRSSGIHSASASPTPSERSSPRSLHSRRNRDISPPLREEEDVSDWEEGEATDDALELPRRVPFPEFGGDIVHHDNAERDFDEVSGSDIQAIDGTWEENWLFQKKKIKTLQSVPVPMLVPNSNTEYRALIGDRDADDTTDLSDNASDQEEEPDEQYKSDIKKVLDSKHVIGGKPKHDDMDFEPDSLTIIDGDDFEQSGTEHEDNVADAVNEQLNNNKVIDAKIIHANDDYDNSHDSILIIDIDSGPLPKTEFSVKEEIHRAILSRKPDKCFDEVDAKINGNSSEDLLDSLSSNKGSTNTLNRHERVGEYEETVTVPVQRYADSLRRKHFDDDTQQIPTRDTDKDVDDLIPGSIAYRERKKWLNYVEMPNNPYSPEAIQKRLSAKSTSSLFDMITTKTKEIDDENPKQATDEDVNKNVTEDEIPVKEEASQNKPALVLNGDAVHMNGTRSKSPSPKILKDVLAEEVPQYKRYGRDYYIKEAKASSGGRKKTSLSDASSLSSLNKSASLDNFDTELAPVSASSSLGDLEACALHQNIVRAVLSPRNASPNFAINPIFENPDKHDNADENHATDTRNVSRNANGSLIKQFNAIATNQQYTKFAVDDQTYDSISTMPRNNDTILIEYEDLNEHTLFSAKPAYVDDDDTDKKFEEILQTAYNTNTPSLDVENKEMEEPAKSPTNLSVDNSYISSSSLEDSIKIYNVQTGEIVRCKPEDNVSPRYEVVTDTNDNIDIPDNNVFEEAGEKFSPNIELVEESVIIEESFDEDLSERNSEIDDILAQLPKVKELAKKFVSMDNLNEPAKLPQPYSYMRRRKSKENILNGDSKPSNKQVYMHSLTARSISKEFREELKLSMATPLTVPGGSKEIPEGEEVTKESSRPGSPLPEPGTIKSKLAFFESLKSKFNNK